jgi:hypothetical protein
MESEKISRTPRELETREATERTKTWRPPSLLPVPAPRRGVSYRWVRTSTFGNTDNKNVSARFREGWVPVKAADHPELMLTSDKDSQYPDGIEVGGLLLCQTSNEIVEARRRYYGNRAQDQIDSVDNSYLRDNDPAMPKLKPERRTRVSRGKIPIDET